MYSADTRVNTGVMATLTGCSKPVTVTNNSGMDYLFADNGDFTFYFIDSYGNTGSTEATVNIIDKIAPVCGDWMPSDGVFTGVFEFTLTGSTDEES